MLNSQLTDCVDAARAAARGAAGWGAFVERIAEMLPGTKVALSSRRGDVHLGVIAHGYDPQLIADYTRHYFRIDPWSPLVERMALLAPEATDHVLPARLFRNHEFYSGFLAAAGEADSATVMKLFHEGDAIATLRLNYGPHLAPAYNRIAPDLLAALAPHLAHAIAVGQAIDRAGEAPGRIAGLVHQFGAAAFLVDGNGALIEANARGRLMLDQGALAGLAGGTQLWIANRGAQEKLAQTLAPDHRSNPASALNDPRSAWRFLEFAQEPADPRLAWLPPRRKWVLALFGSSHLNSLARIGTQSYNFTQQEARIAMSLVDGLTVREMADTFGIASDTVRKHLKALFAKTGTHRQAELVQLLSVVPTEDG